MTEAHTDTVRRREPAAAFDLRKRLDELARGECSADEFIRETLRGANGSSGAWDILSYIDQRYRLGHLSDDLFHSIKSGISLNALQEKEFGTTVELLPIGKQEARKAAPSTPTAVAATTTAGIAATPAASPLTKPVTLATARNAPAAARPDAAIGAPAMTPATAAITSTAPVTAAAAPTASAATVTTGTAPVAAVRATTNTAAAVTSAKTVAPATSSDAAAASAGALAGQPATTAAGAAVNSSVAAANDVAGAASSISAKAAAPHTSTVASKAAAAAPVTKGPARPGRLLNDRYLLESALGSGGMGTVFKALDRRAPLPAQATRRVALKVLHNRTGERAAVQVQLRREFYCTQMLSHPNIVKVFELDRDGDLAYYTMELLDGEPLHQLIARTRPAGLPRPYAWAIIRSVGAALAHAHSRNVIHGDLKPQNVMVTEDGEVRVLDFGSSRTSSDDAGDEGGLLTATPPYASCDVLEGARPDACDDLYSLACLTYELLTGEHPFQSKNAVRARTANERPARPTGLSAQSWQALCAALSWSRAERSVPVGEWLTRLGVDIGPQRLPAFSPTPPRWHERLRAFPWRDFVAPLAAAAIALMLWPALFRGRPPTPVMPETTTAAPANTAQSAASAAAPPAIPASTARLTASQSPTRAASPAIRLAASQPARAPTAAQPASSQPRVPSPAAPQTPVLVPPAPARSATAPARSAQALSRGDSKPSVTLTVRRRQIDRRTNFVEVRVRGNETAREFSWWTEDGSAHAGVDYVAQARTQRPFTRQRRTATLFVRLIPATGNHGASTFYVNIAGPAGTNTGIARTAIELRGISSR